MTQARTSEAAPGREASFGEGFLADLWYVVGLAAEFRRGRIVRRELQGEILAVGRDRAGRLFALRDICPHRAAPLSAGDLAAGPDGAEAVRCPYHGWTFRLEDGACSSIPSLVEGQEVDLERIRVRRYPVRESQGLVYVYAASDPRSGEPESEPPTFPLDGLGAPKVVETLDLASHVDHAVVGLMDPTHGPYVHQQWWWRSSARQLVKAKAFEPRELGFAMSAHVPSRNSRAYRLLGGAPETEIVFRLPGYRWEVVRAGGRRVVALTCLTPLSSDRTRILQAIWSDHWALALLRPLAAAGARAFLRQDARMVELQSEGLKRQPALIWIDDADRQAKWYQALKRAWRAHRRDGTPFANPIAPTVLRWRS